MNAKDVANKIKIASKNILKTKKGRIGLIVTICCATAITAISMSAVGNLHTESNTVKPKARSTLSIPTVIEKVQPVSDEDSMSSTAASTVSVVSSPSKAEKNSDPASSSTPAPKSSTQSSQTHYVVVEPASPREKTTAPATTPSADTSSHVANYQGINVTKTYTDEITGVQQTVQFGGVGAGYREVAVAGITMSVPTTLAQQHSGFGTVQVAGTNGFSQGGATGSTGASMTIGNLTAGTYTVTITAHDGTVTAKIHFTVKSGGLI